MNHLVSKFIFCWGFIFTLIACSEKSTPTTVQIKPIIISTWNMGQGVNKEAWTILGSNGTALDAIEKGNRWMEDQIDCCVGLGGNPDREGIVTLDACIMDHLGNCGSVGAIERIKHPITVARQVMEKTPHVLLVGEGAQQFALSQGHQLEPSDLSKDAKNVYTEWLATSKYQPIVNIENAAPKTLPSGEDNHDTMAALALDQQGNVSGGVTTSGMAFKMRGRLGDSPIIGAGLFVDNEVGAATATGVGEEVIKIAGSHLVVELMRQGHSPQKACEEAVQRIIDKQGDQTKEIQVGFIALNKEGAIGAYALQHGFTYAVKHASLDTILLAAAYYPPKESSR